MNYSFGLLMKTKLEDNNFDKLSSNLSSCLLQYITTTSEEEQKQLSNIIPIINDHTGDISCKEILIVRIDITDKIEYIFKNETKDLIIIEETFTDEDKEVLQTWLGTEDKKYYLDEYYRVDLVNCILLIKEYIDNLHKIFVGFILENSLNVKANLMITRQNDFQVKQLKGFL